MPLRARRLATFAAAAAVLLSFLPAGVSALEASQPLPGYQPVFVTERAPGVWQDCLWASSSMLLDKWTAGALVVDRERLRGLSGGRVGGSSLADVKRAFAALDIDLRWSPSGGASTTWPILLARLAAGGGAVLLGHDSRLPAYYGRWDPAFSRLTGNLDDHALYLDRYDARTDQVFVLDPLAPTGWGGEWIPVWALERFAFHTGGGALWTAMTPAATPLPFAGVKLGAPGLAADGDSIRITWPITVSPPRWSFPGVDLAATVTRIAVPDPAEPVVSASPATIRPGSPAPRLAMTLQAAGLTATAPLPPPGVYRVTVAAKDHRFGRAVAAAGPFTLYVPGDRWATYVLPANLAAEVGSTFLLSVAVTNAGRAAWADPESEPAARVAEIVPRAAHLVGTWTLDPGAPGQAGESDGGASSVVPSAIDFGPVPLAPGGSLTLRATLTAPSTPGAWRLQLDVVDALTGSYAAAGSAPGIIEIDVRPSETEQTPH